VTLRRALVGSALVGSALVGSALVGSALVGCGGRGGERPPANVLAHHAESWCPDGFETGPQDTCFALPETHDAKTPILVYLHGMYQGRGGAEEWSAVRDATKRGFAVVMPRGKRGLCAWTAELKDHFCWPTEVDDPHAFESIVAEWDRVLWQVDSLLDGGDGHKRYVLGFSNGAFFAEYLAARGLFSARGYAILHGGALVPPEKTENAAPIFLLGAEGDEHQGPKMRDLHGALTKAAWPHAWCTRPGGYGLLASDVDAALRFFRRDADGTLKPRGGGFACEGAVKPGR
jgi:predicted esterase